MDYHNFEENIHLLVLERGKAYFDRGAVRELTEQASGWAALVQGEKTYRVLLHGREVLEEWVCDCPDVHGPVCKHVAAVLYAIRDQAIAGAEALLDDLSNEEARAYLKWQLRQSPAIRQMLRRYVLSVSGNDEEE